jgi:hypothetical protein
MIRKAKTLAVALLAIGALGAVIASGASAAQFHVKDMGTVTGHGTQLAQKTQFAIPEGALVCKNVIFNIHTFYEEVSGKEVHKETTAPTVTIKAEEPGPQPETLNCTFGGISGSIVHMNGCDFRLHSGPPIVATVICPPEKQITITAIVVGVLKCTIHIGTQTDLQGITIDNTKEPTTDLDATFDITKTIKYTSTPGEGLGKCAETQAGTDGDFTGTVTVQGTANGVASDIWYE